ncbi:MAG: glycosyl hydrolase [Sphingobacteriales bacterium 12-47-4]|nr:MAG: glycosyl hydrolase [Sphingobacteriales bacterium 12-47-4]
MQKTILAVASFFLLASCNDSESTKEKEIPAPTTASYNSLTEQEKSDGWQLLFDGSTKTGWHVYNAVSDGSAWVIDSGTLHLDPKEMIEWQTKGGGDIVTDAEYENFHLKLDWKIDTAGNSGVMFYIHESPDTSLHKYAWYTGPEMQVLDNARHGDANNGKHRAGDLYDLISSSPETVKPAGEWNQVEIIANKGSLELFLNGTKVVQTTLWDDNWKKLVAGSKFIKMPEFGTYKKGRIGLQDHGNKVWFRNVKIKSL